MFPGRDFIAFVNCCQTYEITKRTSTGDATHEPLREDHHAGVEPAAITHVE